MDHAEFIEALGGGTKVAALLSEETGENIDREAVYKWRGLNRVPFRWRPHLVVIARRIGVKLPQDFVPGVRV